VRNILLGAAVGLCAAIVSYAGVTDAQEPACRFFKLQTDNTNISKEPRGDSTYIDVLDSGEIVCVTEEQSVGERDWVFVAHRLAKPAGAPKPVRGWVNAKLLQPASAAEVAAVQRIAAPAPAPVAAAPSAPPPSAPQQIIRFTEPLPFGPISVAGKSLQQLAAAAPQFPPVGGLTEAQWKKPCASCHRWTKATLCDVGKTYIKNPAGAFRHQHPDGGPMKVAMLEWAKQGCQ
jgi:hypothetical protein